MTEDTVSCLPLSVDIEQYFFCCSVVHIVSLVFAAVSVYISTVKFDAINALFKVYFVRSYYLVMVTMPSSTQWILSVC